MKLVIQDGKVMANVNTPILISSGAYSGDGTQNRAIAHGLPIIPTIVWIASSSGSNNTIRGTKLNNMVYQVTVTAPDGTNFYVGSASPDFYCNVLGHSYNWVAISTGGG